MNLYDKKCPECGGKITSTAKSIPPYTAPTHCENGHTFPRNQAVASTKSGIKIEAATRLLASAVDLAVINKLTNFGISESQADGIGYRLNHAQSKKALDYLLKEYGKPEDWHAVKNDIHRGWHVGDHVLCFDCSRFDPSINPLVYLEK